MGRRGVRLSRLGMAQVNRREMFLAGAATAVAAALPAVITPRSIRVFVDPATILDRTWLVGPTCYDSAGNAFEGYRVHPVVEEENWYGFLS